MPRKFSLGRHCLQIRTAGRPCLVTVFDFDQKNAPCCLNAEKDGTGLCFRKKQSCLQEKKSETPAQSEALSVDFAKLAFQAALLQNVSWLLARMRMVDPNHLSQHIDVVVLKKKKKKNRIDGTLRNTA